MDEEAQLERGIALGEWLTAKRGQRSVRSIAQRAGFSSTYLRQIEAGFDLRKGHRIPVSPSPEILSQLADSLGVDRQEVFRRAGMDADAGSDLPAPSDDVGLLIEQLKEIAVELADAWKRRSS